MDGFGPRDGEMRLVAHDQRVDALAGQGALDERRLAVDVADAATFLVQRFDDDVGDHDWNSTGSAKMAG
jgi:hypothetical protein